MFCLHICIHTVCLGGACGGQKALDLLELWLWMIVRYDVGARSPGPLQGQRVIQSHLSIPFKRFYFMYMRILPVCMLGYPVLHGTIGV